MKRILAVLVFSLFLFRPVLFCTGGACASEIASARHIDPYESAYIHKFLKPGDYLPVEDVKEGDEGYGLSVFHGTTPQKFKVKVIGVMKQVLNGRDSILIRISGDVLKENNVVRGMSGSPIYIRNKLVGALSYGFDFSKEPIVGVTPIVDMLDAIIKPSDKESLNISSLPARPLRLDRLESNSAEILTFRRALVAREMGSGAPQMVPLLTPVALAGFSNRASRFLGSKLKAAGLEVAAGASGGLNGALSKGASADTLLPGSAVSLLLSTGDFSSAATGTVTGVFDNRVLAFGHPLIEAGAVDIPMSSAYIHDILPSLSVSFKMSSPLKILGRIYADRPWSVGGELGKQANLIPVDITVVDGQRHFRKDFHSKVINHPDLTSDLVSAVIMSAIDASFQSAQAYTTTLKSSIKVKGGRLVERSDNFASFASSSGGLSILGFKFFSDPVVSYVDSVVSSVYNNKFKKAEIESVKLEIKFEVGKNSTAIKRVIVENPVVEPGGKVKFGCILEPFGKERTRQSFSFNIPRDLPDGDYLVGVSGGAFYKALRKNMKLFDPPAKNIDQMLDKVLENPNANQLVALLALPDQAILLHDSVVQNPPGHWSKLFFSDRYTNGPRIVAGERRYLKQLDSYVTGSHVVGFTVKRKSPFEQENDWYQSESSSGKGASSQYITDQARKIIGSFSKITTAKVVGGAATTTTSSTTSSDKTAKGSTSSGSKFASGITGLHTRYVKAWNQSTDTSFSGGMKENCTIDSWGRLFPGFEKTDKHRLDKDIRAWSSTVCGGVFYFSTSNKIYSWSGGKEPPRVLARLKTAIIPAITSDNSGTVYAACVPEGKLVTVSKDGSVKDFYKLSESVISACATDLNGNVYIGTAGNGMIYKLDPTGKLISKTDTGQAHVTCLTYSKNEGLILVGTGENGNVYSLSADGTFKAEYQGEAHIVTGVARDRKKNLFLTTAGPGSLVMVEPSGQAKSLATSDAFYHLYYDKGTDSIFTGDAEGDVTQIQIEPLPDRAFFVPVIHSDQDAVVSLNGDSNSNLYVLTSNLPTVEKVLLKPLSSSVFTSSVNDADRPAYWSKLRVYGAYNQFDPIVKDHLKVESRTGNTVRPDSTWDSWRECTRSDDGFKVGSKIGRYFQYRLTWQGKIEPNAKDLTFPMGHESVIGRIETTYLPSNSTPTVTSFTLASGSFVSGDKELKLVASDPDGDNLALTVEISSDAGKSWKVFEEDLRGNEKKKSEIEAKKKAKEKAKTKSKKSSESKPSSKDKDKESASQNSTSNSKGDSSDSKSEDSETKDSSGDSDSAKDEKETEKETEKEKPDSEDDKKDELRATSSRLRILSKVIFVPKKKSLQSAGDSFVSAESDSDSETGKGQSVKPSSSKDKGGKAASGKKGESGSKDDKKSSISSVADGRIEWTWFTKKHKDGIHMLRFRLSDAPSNGGNSEVSKNNYFYRTVVIDNKEPDLSNIDCDWSGRTLKRLSLRASDKWSPVVNAVFESSEGESFALVPQEGLADGKDVVFVAKEIKFKKMPKFLTIEVTDKAGNVAKKKVDVKK